MQRSLAHALVGAGMLSSCLMISNAGAETVEVGVVKQIAPRPLIWYGGAFGQYITSSLVQNPDARTLVTIDLYSLMQAAGISWLERIDILDPGNNAYGGSPGCDIDYFHIDGAPGDMTTTFSYTGPNPVHTGESSASLATRLSLMDSVSGDQDWNSAHFISLGQNGMFSAMFSIPASPGGNGGGGGGGGGAGPGESQGGGVPGSLNLFQAMPGLKLHLSETGASEMYEIRLVGYAVPGPAVASLLALVPALLGSRRRRA